MRCFHLKNKYKYSDRFYVYQIDYLAPSASKGSLQSLFIMQILRFGPTNWRLSSHFWHTQLQSLASAPTGNVCGVILMCLWCNYSSVSLTNGSIRHSSIRNQHILSTSSYQHPAVNSCCEGWLQLGSVHLKIIPCWQCKQYFKSK